jgi:hypothetical protein
MSIYQARKLLDLNWLLRKSGLLPKEEAANVNRVDEVADSTWFANRHARQRLSREALARGPGSGLPPSGPWTVIKGKSVGVSPGFVAKDELGRRLFVKFDPPDYPGMGTNADVIVSRVLHAAGYHVPEYYRVVIDPNLLTLRPDARIPGEYKVPRPMTPDDLDRILAAAPRDREGRIFGNVSIGLPGIPKGAFSFLGSRPDDPNDTIRHEDRRELRGLRVITAWLNDTDERRGNTLDMYVEEEGRRFLKHHLIDFSGALGSANYERKQPYEGHEYYFDPRTVGGSLAALGLWVRPWERQKFTLFPEIGLFDAELFSPADWRAYYPNPAFEKMTARDGFWAAAIVTAFTDDDIRTLVRTGDFPTPGAEDYLVKTLIERRDKIGRHWFDVTRINPLDAWRVDAAPDGRQELSFRDLGIARGYADAAVTLYRYRVNGGDRKTTPSPRIPLPAATGRLLLELQTSRDGGRHWGRAVTVTLEPADGQFTIDQVTR